MNGKMLRSGSLGLLVLASTACGVGAWEEQEGPRREEPIGETRAALYLVGTCSSESSLGNTRTDIRWAAPVSALPMIERAFNWTKVTRYNRGWTCATNTACCNGACGGAPTSYRQDCSGYVSEAWRLDLSATTATLGNYSRNVTWAQLAIGDAINLPGADGVAHAEIFGGWMDDAKTQFCTIELEGNYSPTATIRPALQSSHSSYTPLRKNGWIPWGYRTSLESDTDDGLFRDCVAAQSGSPIYGNCTGADNQKWVIIGNAGFGANEGWIQQKDTNQCLVPAGLSHSASVNLVACDTSVAKQRWKFDNLRLKVGDLGCLEADTSTTTWNVKLDPSCGPIAQRNWDYDPRDKTLKVTVGGETRCLDVADGQDGTWLKARACDGSTAQQWQRGGGGLATALASGRCVDASGTQVKLHDCDGTEPQRIALRGTLGNAADNALCLAHETTGNGLTVKNCDSTQNVQLWQFWSKD